MNNNEIFKKLRVALMLRDEQIIDILKLVDFNVSKSELGAFFRDEKHPNYRECGDQILRNFLNGMVIHYRGTKENPKKPVIVKENSQFEDKKSVKKTTNKPKINSNSKTIQKTKDNKKNMPVVEKVKFKNKK